MITQAQYEHLWELIQPVGTVMLSSVDGSVIRARPMQMLQKEFDGDLWFISHKQSHKIDELKAISQVNMTVMDTSHDVFVSMSGQASISQDDTMKRQLWSSSVDPWFENGAEDENAILLKINVHEAELWNIKDNSVMKMIKSVVAKVGDGTPDIGENQKYG